MPGLAETEQQRQALLSAFPEACRTNCTVAKLAVDCVLEERTAFIATKAAECVDGPETDGRCGTEKGVCHHSGSGDTKNFHEQIGNLVTYLSLE